MTNERKVYKVVAVSTDYPYIYVQADSLEEACEYAEDIDGGEFIIPDAWEGSWHIAEESSHEVDPKDVNDRAFYVAPEGGES